MRKTITLTMVLLAPLLTALLRGQVVESKKGPVEFIGLEDWTPQDAQAKLERLPDGDLHYCAADLKKAGFADASVIIHLGAGRSLYTVVTVVEPKYAAGIAYRGPSESVVAVPPTWAALEEATRSGHLLEGGLFGYGATLPFGRQPQPDLPKAPPDWWSTLKERSTEADYQKALETIGASANAADRSVAALVLMNFADHDAAWQALAGGLRDSDSLVSSICQQALGSLRLHAPKRVDWASVAADLASVLHGTNLFGFQELVQTLTATGVQPYLAADLLGHGGGRLVLAYLRAQHRDEHNAAHALLVQLRAADLGDLPGPWEAWVATL